MSVLAEYLSAYY